MFSHTWETLDDFMRFLLDSLSYLPSLSFSPETLFFLPALSARPCPRTKRSEAQVPCLLTWLLTSEPGTSSFLDSIVFEAPLSSVCWEDEAVSWEIQGVGSLHTPDVASPEFKLSVLRFF